MSSMMDDLVKFSIFLNSNLYISFSYILLCLKFKLNKI